MRSSVAEAPPQIAVSDLRLGVAEIEVDVVGIGQDLLVGDGFLEDARLLGGKRRRLLGLLLGAGLALGAVAEMPLLGPGRRRSQG